MTEESRLNETIPKFEEIEQPALKQYNDFE